ncbi:sensor histidine kinase [Chryseosolibacter indicus]|uniref:Histidine kinase n=1 Tax=Chryseosolibacter indicus TaxID=2782351 RepID=A0ABS5VQ64_9BACT|nr:histidine kinase [Chryseosolibacter indicus]
MNRQRLYWTLQIGGWLLYAIVQIVASLLATTNPSSNRIYFLLYESFLCLLVTHLFRIFFHPSKWLKLSINKLIVRVILSVFVLGLSVYFLRIPLSLMLGLFDKNVAFDLSRIWGLSSVYTVIFFIWCVLYFTIHYIDQYNKSLKYEASMVEIELNNLKSQLNPHFIFNALNSIRALVDENPAKSKQAINQLSNILRSSLASDKKGLMKFDDELKIVKDYLGLESIRFEERLKTEFDIHPGSHDFYVPPLMIQTIVENGIKHGISKLTAGGTIQLKTSVQNQTLKVSIRNTGQLTRADVASDGVGLRNTIQRLKLLYGDEASFRIVNENHNFVLTEIIIPQNRRYESINRG